MSIQFEKDSKRLAEVSKDIAFFIDLAKYGKDEQVRYRAREMVRLLGEKGRIKEFDYGLCNQVPDHADMTDVGRMAVIFLTGTRVTASLLL